MRDFLAAVGLVLVIEGLVYGGFPGLARKLASEVLDTPENVLRIGGLVAIAAASAWCGWCAAEPARAAESAGLRSR